MKALPIEHLHEELHAKMGEFAGWHMPFDYGSVVAEVNAVRQRAGLFDISHMGRLELVGENSGPVLEYLSSNDVTALKDGAAHYSLLLNASGGVHDDVIIYRQTSDDYYIIVNAANTEHDSEWISGHLEGDVRLKDLTSESVLFALQGPLSKRILERTGVKSASELKKFHLTKDNVSGVHCIIARTGYTGEDGFEIAARREDGEALWSALMEAGGEEIASCGLAARDVLRIEAGYSLYGHEIDEVTNPVEAGLMRFVKTESRRFVGRDAIIQAIDREQARRLIGLEMESRSVPRDGDMIYQDDQQIGYVSSGTFSPTLSKGIALAFVSPERAVPYQQVEVEIRGVRKLGILRIPPLTKRRSVYGEGSES